MGSCLSTISKDRLLGLEEFMKNATSLEKGKVRPSLDRLKRGDIYEDPFHKGTFKKRNVCSITNWGVVETPFLKWVRCINKNLRCTLTQGTP